MVDNSIKPKRVVVLISGSGSNLQAIIDQQESGQLPIEICAIISNRDGVKGLTRAHQHNIPAIVLDHKQFPSREAFDLRLQAIIDSQAPDIVVLAGFMRILTQEFTRHYEGRMINIHPSLLPKYQGLHTHRRALEAGDDEHGATVHFVTAELDGGPPIIQARVNIEKDETEATLAAKVLLREHQIYPIAIQWLAQSRLQMIEGKTCLDGERLPDCGYQFTV
ncbi:MAG: phosphoribosylglycinamide formyltransferase-1 [Lentisphaeria bacterium]